MQRAKFRALKAARKLQRVKVTAEEDVGPWQLIEGSVSLQRGKEGEVPRWLTGVTQILKPTQRLTLQELNRVLFQETQSASKPASLVPLHRDFYARVRELLNELKGQPDVSKKAESVARELVTLRLRKIMNLAFLGVQDPSIVQGMTDEELLLFSEIRELVNLYYGELIGERA